MFYVFSATQPATTSIRIWTDRAQTRFHNPDEVDVENVAAKLDRAAAQRRSAIRREPSVRPGRDQSSSIGLTNIIRNRHELLLQARRRAERDVPETNARLEALEAEMTRLRRQQERASPRLSAEQTRARLLRHIEHTPHGTLDVPVSDVYLTTHENDVAPSESSSENVLLPRPTRESNLRFELGAVSPNLSNSPQQNHSFIPSPPHSLTDTARNRPVDGPLETWESSPPLTQGFAPAHAARAAIGRVDSPASLNSEAPRAGSHDRQGLETPPPESWEDSYPTLRRVPHMSPRPLPRSSVDGLGDRHRSPSPLSETQEEETWNNLLATMDNSYQSSSTATSFASMTDLLSTSRSSSYPSSNTQNTSTSFGEIGSSADDMCDLPPGITEEDARQIRERHRRSGRRVLAPRRQISDFDPSDHGLQQRRDDDTNTFIPGLSLRGDSPLSVLLREARDSRGLVRRSRDELAMFQAIVERQHSHEHIPDEWWALAGIPSSLAHLARTQHE